MFNVRLLLKMGPENIGQGLARHSEEKTIRLAFSNTDEELMPDILRTHFHEEPCFLSGVPIINSEHSKSCHILLNVHSILYLLLLVLGQLPTRSQHLLRCLLPAARRRPFPCGKELIEQAATTWPRVPNQMPSWSTGIKFGKQLQNAMLSSQQVRIGDAVIAWAPPDRTQNNTKEGSSQTCSRQSSNST